MTDAEKLQAVRAALFPEPEQHADNPNHYTSHDALENLDAAIYDLERTKADAGCVRTLQRIAGQLRVAERIVKTTDE